MSATTMPAAAAPAMDPKVRFGFMMMVFGMFMAILDIQIVSASIAEIQAGLAASPDEASWVQTSYLIAEIVMIPLSGFLSRALSSRVLFTLSCAGFTLFSGACAQNLGGLISVGATVKWIPRLANHAANGLACSSLFNYYDNVVIYA